MNGGTFIVGGDDYGEGAAHIDKSIRFHAKNAKIFIPFLSEQAQRKNAKHIFIISFVVYLLSCNIIFFIAKPECYYFSAHGS